MSKNLFKHLNPKEEILYLAIWLVVFLFPLVVGSTHTAQSTTLFSISSEVLVLWRFQLIFLACFVVHNHLLAPRLVYAGRRPFYAIWAILLLLLFTTAHSLVTRSVFREGHRPPREAPIGKWQKQGRGASHTPPSDVPFAPGQTEPPPSAAGERAAGDLPPVPPEDDMSPESPNARNGQRHPDRRHNRRPHRRDENPPFLFFFFVTPHEISALFTMALLFGLNLAVKYTFKSDEQRKRISALERSNLEQQLKYLKYQINPHFFMNTLNNIHALVDINPEEAKHTVLILSKMMRYVLYDGERPLIALRKEADFISHYVQLMRIRYASHVDIRFNAPDDLPEAQVPPLLLITFVENAFKHGVSASHPSFVHIHLECDGETQHIRFSVTNSLRHATPEPVPSRQAAMDSDRQGGVGLKNALERLRLIYGEAYAYTPVVSADSYTVTLALPYQP